MAMGIYNQDSSFFDIQVGGSTITDILKNRIMSFSVTEEMSCLFTGNIQTLDPHTSMSDAILLRGKTIKITWGYKKPDSSLIAAFAKRDNPKEVTGQFQRADINAYIQNVSGTGGSDGVMTYSADFIGTVANIGGKRRTWSSGTRKKMIQDVMGDMKIEAGNQHIKFARENDSLNGDTAKTQYESNFRFLNRMAREHGSVFMIGHGGGKDHALFADYKTTEMEKFCNSVGSSDGNTLTLNYREGTPNVESYSFQQNSSSEAGDNAQIMMVNGQVTIKRFNAATQTVSDYRLNMEKLRKDMKAQKGASNLIKFTEQLITGEKFQFVKTNPYFEAVVSTTAPQGYGWTIKARMLGNPLVTAPMLVRFGDGFPSVLSSMSPAGTTSSTGGMKGSSSGGLNKVSKANFWIRAVTHTIDENGYHMDLDIADALTISGGSFVS